MSGFDVVLVGCGGSKVPHPAPAKDLYTSSLFRKSRAWAEQHGTTWYVVSAKHGLVDPNEVLAPYDVRLGQGRTAPPIWPWAHRVVDPLLERQPTLGRVAILAGQVYVGPLRHLLTERGVEVADPLAGLEIGQRLQWLTRAARVDVPA